MFDSFDLAMAWSGYGVTNGVESVGRGVRKSDVAPVVRTLTGVRSEGALLKLLQGVNMAVLLPPGEGVSSGDTMPQPKPRPPLRSSNGFVRWRRQAHSPGSELCDPPAEVLEAASEMGPAGREQSLRPL